MLRRLPARRAPRAARPTTVRRPDGRRTAAKRDSHRAAVESSHARSGTVPHGASGRRHHAGNDDARRAAEPLRPRERPVARLGGGVVERRHGARVDRHQRSRVTGRELSAQRTECGSGRGHGCSLKVVRNRRFVPRPGRVCASACTRRRHGLRNTDTGMGTLRILTKRTAPSGSPDNFSIADSLTSALRWQLRGERAADRFLAGRDPARLAGLNRDMAGRIRYADRERVFALPARIRDYSPALTQAARNRGEAYQPRNG